MAIVTVSASATTTVTARTLIIAALRKIRAVSPEETPEPYQIQNGLEALNDLLSSWATERLLVHSITQYPLSLTAGTNNYTIGQGGTFDQTRPQRVEGGFIRDNGTDYPLTVITRESYRSIDDKSTLARPEWVYYDASYSLGKFYFYSTPDQAYTAYLDIWEPLSEFASENTEYTLPLEYKLPLKSDLAIILAAEYGKEVVPDLREIARTSKGAIKRLNSTPMAASLDYFNNGGWYNIYSDSYS